MAFYGINDCLLLYLNNLIFKYNSKNCLLIHWKMIKYQCGSEIMKNEDKIMKVIKNGYLKTSDLKKIDVSKHYLSLLQKEKVIEKVSRGLYL